MRDHYERVAVPGQPDESGYPNRGLHPDDLAEDLVAAGMDPSLLGDGLG